MRELLSDGIFQAFGKFIQQSTMVMSMTFLKSKYRKQEFELAAYDTLSLKYKLEPLRGTYRDTGLHKYS